MWSATLNGVTYNIRSATLNYRPITLHLVSCSKLLVNYSNLSTYLWHIIQKNKHPLAELAPVIASLSSEDLTELFSCLSKGLVWSVLILTSIPNSPPACEEYIQIFGCMTHNLFIQQHTQKRIKVYFDELGGNKR